MTMLLADCPDSEKLIGDLNPGIKIFA